MTLNDKNVGLYGAVDGLHCDSNSMCGAIILARIYTGAIAKLKLGFESDYRSDNSINAKSKKI